MPADSAVPAVIAPPADFNGDPAWDAYDSAFRDAAAGDLDGARSRLSLLATQWPAHPARTRAEALTARLTGQASARGISRAARGEFVFWTTLGGVLLAGNICIMLDCSTDRERAGIFTLTAGGALAVSLLATRGGLHQGEAQLYNSAQTWASWNALLVNDGFASTTEEAGVSVAMQLGGLAGGIGLWQVWRPTQGDVALVNTFLLWGTVMTTWGLLAADEEPRLAPIVLAGDVAMLAGAIVARYVKMSRGRTLLIDVGGLLGTMAGGLVALGTSDSESGAGLALGLGTAAGLGIAAFATQGWDKAPPVQISPTVIPASGAVRAPAYGISAGLSF